MQCIGAEKAISYQSWCNYTCGMIYDLGIPINAIEGEIAYDSEEVVNGGIRDSTAGLVIISEFIY